MTDLKQVATTILGNFSGDQPVLNATLTAMAVITCLLFGDLPHCIGLNFTGPPSSAKTTVLDFFKGASMVHHSDNFTPRSFVSHSATATEKELSSIDMLPRIQHKCLIIPELAPTFSARSEDLTERVAILTRIFDGSGYTSESGVHGLRGYSGDYRFAWLGATTPLLQAAWDVMGKLGSRFVFFNMTAPDSVPQDLANMLGESLSYRAKINQCQEAVVAYMEELWVHHGGYGAVRWDSSSDDPALLLQIAKMASNVAKWRGVIYTQSLYAIGSNPPQIEQPQRLAATLHYIAKGFALVYGRDVLTQQDIDMVRPIAYSSMPESRRRIHAALTSGVTLCTKEVEGLIGVSNPTALKVMKELEFLGAVKPGKKGQSDCIQMA
jgi:hypothetical protein